MQLLLEKEQLRSLMVGQEDVCPLLRSLSEGPLHFRPTYKFDIGTDTWDTSVKRRVPSWTDRILFSDNGASGDSLDLLAYDSCMDAQDSDHKPVVATFECPFVDSKVVRAGPGFAGAAKLAVQAQRATAAKRGQDESEVCSIM